MKHPPYNLRTNKAIDRLLLAEIIRKLDPEAKNFTYYAMGGPFLEDLRIMDHFFPELKLVSVEKNYQTYIRQEFNKFSRRIELKHVSLFDFLLRDYAPQSKDIFWLDYTDLRYERFVEFQMVLQKVLPGSVIRITLRAEPEINLLEVQSSLSETELSRLQTKLAEDFNNRFDKLLDEKVEDEIFVSHTKFARLIQNMIRISASQALDSAGSTVEFVPVQSTRYLDGTQMLSVTGIVCDRGDAERLLKQIEGMRFSNTDWHEPEYINIPSLSLKERLHLEKHLPVEPGEDAGEILYKLLNYMIDEGVKKSKNQLAHYAQCQRDYPNFVRIFG